MLSSQGLWACADGAKAMGKIVDAATDGKPTPQINARVFGKAADGTDDFTQIRILENGRIQAYTSKGMADVDPKSIETMRAYVNDPELGRIHAFFTSTDKGQDAVGSFFKGAKPGSIDAGEAKRIGDAFKRMSEADQAVLVGGIENKLRAGKQITESEFLIAVKAAPGYRTKPGAVPHLEKLQEAFRSGNLEDAKKIVDGAWVQKSSAETKGIIQRAKNLLARNARNKPPEVLTNLPARPALLGSSDDIGTGLVRSDDGVVAVRRAPQMPDAPKRIEAPRKPQVPAVLDDTDVAEASFKRGGSSGGTADDAASAGNRKVEAWDADGRPIDAEIIDVTPGSVARNSKLVNGADDTVEAITDGRKSTSLTVTTSDDAKALATRGNSSRAMANTTETAVTTTDKATDVARIADDTPQIKLLTYDGKPIKPSLRARFTKLAKNPKVIAAGIIVTACVVESYLNGECLQFLEDAWDRIRGNKTEEEWADIIKDLKLVMKPERKGDVIECHWQVQKNGKEISQDVKAVLGVGEGKLFQVSFKVNLPDFNNSEEEASKITSLENEYFSDQTKYPNGLSNCMSDDGMPDNPCVIQKPIANKKDVNVQYTATLTDRTTKKVLDTANECNNQDNDGVNVGQGPDSTATSPSSTTTVSPSATTTVSPSSTDDSLPWYDEDSSSTSGSSSSSYNFDPFGILQGNDGQKQPLQPPSPLIVPPSNLPQYITPGYY